MIDVVAVRYCRTYIQGKQCKNDTVLGLCNAIVLDSSTYASYGNVLAGSGLTCTPLRPADRVSTWQIKARHWLLLLSHEMHVVLMYLHPVSLCKIVSRLPFLE
jgi:hypothetical protein